MIWALGRRRDSSLESFEALQRKLARFYSLDEYTIRFRCTEILTGHGSLISI